MAYNITSAWQSLYSLTGKPIGTQLYIQNAGMAGDIIEIIRSDTQPSPADRGDVIKSIDPRYRITSASDVWVRYIRYDINETISPGAYRVCLASIGDDELVQDQAGINPEMVGGNQAITVQSFTELNSKKGVQYEVAFNTTLAAGASVFIVLEVGTSNDILIKDVQSQFNSESLTTTLFKSPTYAGGVVLPVFNLNDRDAVPEDVIVRAGVVVTNNGVQVSPEFKTIGSVGAGNREVSTVSLTPDAERVLAKGVVYMYRITNTGTSTTTLAGYSTWYQGPLSTQV